MHLKLQLEFNVNVCVLSNWRDTNAKQLVKIATMKVNYLAKHIQMWWRAAFSCMAPFLTNSACGSFISHSFAYMIDH